MTIRIHPFLWLWIPVALMIGDLLCEIFVPIAARPQFFSEAGPHEKVQALFMFAGLIYATRLFFVVEGIWLKLWFGIAALSCFYIAGEEISWGQTFFGWLTPEFWSQINDQQETNLHNTSDWLDQKPKTLLQIGVLVGGIIIPALQKWRPSALPARYAAIYPTWHVVVTAAFAVLVKIIDTVQDLVHPYTDWRIFWRASEVLEIYIYYFVLIYLIAMWKRFKPA
jgi:hypothetical protein